MLTRKDAEELRKNFKSNTSRYAFDCLDVIREVDQAKNICLVDFLTDSDIAAMVEREAEKGNWYSVKILLADATESAPYGWYMDGYGCVCDITTTDIEMWLDDIIKELD